MIPDFLKSGLLPQGIHWASMREIAARFGSNGHRLHLLSGLNRALGALTVAGCQSLYLDGSFVTAKELPRDYDACWDATGVVVSKLDPVFQEFANRRAAQKAKYFGEFFPSHDLARISPNSFRTFIEFFQTDRDTGDAKGIIGIHIKAKP